MEKLLVWHTPSSTPLLVENNEQTQRHLYTLWQWLIFTYHYIIYPKCPKYYCSRRHEATKLLSTANLKLDIYFLRAC